MDQTGVIQKARTQFLRLEKNLGMGESGNRAGFMVIIRLFSPHPGRGGGRSNPPLSLFPGELPSFSKEIRAQQTPPIGVTGDKNNRTNEVGSTVHSCVNKNCNCDIAAGAPSLGPTRAKFSENDFFRRAAVLLTKTQPLIHRSAMPATSPVFPSRHPVVLPRDTNSGGTGCGGVGLVPTTPP